MTIPKLMPLEEWRTQRFTTPPSPATVRRWITNGNIPGKQIGGKWFVDLEEEMNSSGDELVDLVMRGH